MKIVCSEHINAPVEKVFAVASDVEHATEVISAITKMEVLTAGPVGVGTRFRETRVMFGKEATEEMEFTAFDPPRSYTLVADSHGCHYVSTFRFTPEGAGTRVDFEFTGDAHSFGAKVMSAVMGPLMKGTMRKMLAKDLLELKRYAESK
jgi:carbon monoxide dehydrogenase subunit G